LFPGDLAPPIFTAPMSGKAIAVSGEPGLADKKRHRVAAVDIEMHPISD
jgi:hypothetical protein